MPISTTVVFQLIRQSHVTGPSGPASILVHVTRHYDIGHMRKTVQKIYLALSWTISKILTNCWLKILFVTGHTANGPVSKCDRRVTGHTPGRINRNSTVLITKRSQ